jgi:hypothetical protein
VFLAGLALLPIALSGVPDTVSLTTIAAASPRPPVCRLALGAPEGELWARARRERAQRFCTLLSGAYARLERAPEEALARAREAGKILPNEVEARVLEGRALLRLGNVADAERLLASSVTAPGRPLGDLAGLRELGVAFALTGHLSEAAGAYRVLVPRVGFVKDHAFSRVAVLEAAAASMASSAAGATEAALYLSEARQAEPVPGFQDLTLAFFALALDRDGKAEQAAVALEELGGAWALERFLPRSEPAGAAPDGAASAPAEKARVSDTNPIFAPGELEAAIARAAVRSDPKLALHHFAAFERGPGGRGPWAAWARKWKAQLTRDGRP